MKKFAGIVTLFVLGVILLAGSASAAGRKRVLVLYDQGQDRREPALADAKYLANLLGHFNADVQLAPVAAYRSGGMDRADAVFYINYEKNYAPPPAFREDFYRYGRTFCWLNHQLGSLDQEFLKKNYGFHFREYREDLGFNRIEYNGVKFPKGDENVEMVAIDDPSLARVVSFASNDRGMKTPYILHSRNLWFVADSPFSYVTERDRYIAFADLLHDILGEHHAARHTALVRIEDINPSSDGKALLRIAKYLHSQHVPFAVSLVPVYIDPAEKIELHLEDNPKLLSVLKGLPKRGGALVLHGYTHQYRGSTTDDYEFWDDVADKAVRGDSVENASLRIEKALKECFSNGLYPVAWETPHYFASKNTYLAVKKRFSLTFERRGTMDHLGTDQFLPYEHRDIYGQFVIPENLGYVPIDRPDPRPVIDAARLNLSVRDGYASFFFHPFIEIAHLKKIVKSLKDMGYGFGDIRDFSPAVVMRDRAVVCGAAKLRVATRDRYVFVREFDRGGKKVKEQVLQNEGRPLAVNVAAAKGNWVVVKPQDDLEPGLAARVWRLAKTDLRYVRALRAHASGGRLHEVQQIAFVAPDAFPRDAADAHDLQSLRFSLSVAGLAYKEIPARDVAAQDLREYDIIVMPFAAAKTLKPDAVARVREAVGSGSRILLDGASKLGEELGIELAQEPVKVQQARDYQFPEMPLYWPEAAPVRPVYKSDKDYRILCVEEQSNAPLAVSGKYGSGAFVFLATHFDPHSDRGYSRFPFLFETLQTEFGYQPLAERKAAEMYFDPGMRQFISIEKLARLWRKRGINKIYAGGWHFYDKYAYDYARLIRVCHQNGILVYCWLEPPMVNQKFWNSHPEWREKTAVLKDASFSWRYLMNLADPACRTKALAETEALLKKYDWDGVNIAELFFDSMDGPARPEQFTPMNDAVRANFRKKGGFDPLELFTPGSPRYWKTDDAAWRQFAAYRKNLCTVLKVAYLDMAANVRRTKQNFEVIVTAMDTSLDPRLEDNLGEDMQRLLWLQKKYGFTLQVEDAAPFWSGKPERYAQLGAHYRALVGDASRLQLDCNVLDNHKKGNGGLPAEKPTGEEMRQLAYHMASAGCRPVFYSEDSINENDFRNISTALACNAVVTPAGENRWRVSTPSMVTIRAGKKGLVARLNGEPWFAGEGDGVIVPAGEHTVRFESEPRYFDMTGLRPRLASISADLKWASFFNDAVEFAYDSGPAPCLVIVSKRPGRILVDDKKTAAPVYEGDGGFAVKLPGGSHRVRIAASGGLARLVETSGVVFFSLVIIFGFVSSILFIGLFVLIRIKRRIVKPS